MLLMFLFFFSFFFLFYILSLRSLKLEYQSPRELWDMWLWQVRCYPTWQMCVCVCLCVCEEIDQCISAPFPVRDVCDSREDIPYWWCHMQTLASECDWLKCQCSYTPVHFLSRLQQHFACSPGDVISMECLDSSRRRTSHRKQWGVWANRSGCIIVPVLLNWSNREPVLQNSPLEPYNSSIRACAKFKTTNTFLSTGTSTKLEVRIWKSLRFDNHYLYLLVLLFFFISYPLELQRQVRKLGQRFRILNSQETILLFFVNRQAFEHQRYLQPSVILPRSRREDWISNKVGPWCDASVLVC